MVVNMPYEHGAVELTRPLQWSTEANNDKTVLSFWCWTQKNLTRMKTIVSAAVAMSFAFFFIPFVLHASKLQWFWFDLLFRTIFIMCLYTFGCGGTSTLILCGVHSQWLVIFRYHAISTNFLGSFVLLWRRGSSVLTAGHLKIARDDRFKIVDDYNLQISNVRTQDAGDYICQIGDQETRDQVHTVEILGKITSYFDCLLYVQSVCG